MDNMVQGKRLDQHSVSDRDEIEAWEREHGDRTERDSQHDMREIGRRIGLAVLKKLTA